MKNRNVSLKCTWKNAVIWSVVTAVAGLLYRYAVLWFCVPAQMVVNDGGVETIINFTSDYFTMCMTLLLPCVFIPIGAYLLMYHGYMRIAGENPSDLHAVAIGRYGRPWIGALIVQIVLSLAWMAVGALFIFLDMETALNSLSLNDRHDIRQFLMMMLIVLVLDLPMFYLGKRLFKPDLVQING